MLKIIAEVLMAAEMLLSARDGAAGMGILAAAAAVIAAGMN